MYGGGKGYLYNPGPSPMGPMQRPMYNFNTCLLFVDFSVT